MLVGEYWFVVADINTPDSLDTFPGNKKISVWELEQGSCTETGQINCGAASDNLPGE